ncbi:MAG: bifunctional DNA-formamidopyrimidine glycosylase/DNA-(apurinic or apyrimidinic site) lyase [Nitrospiria bacterium]
MPELPEVESIVRRLRPSLVGRVIERIDIARPDIVSPGLGVEALLTRTIAQVLRHGKTILVGLDPPLWLVIRLGMTGRCSLLSPGAPRVPHTHAIITLSGASHQLRYSDPRRFGGWRVVESVADITRAPDALAVRRAAWRAIFTARHGQLRPLLMNQRVLAGLGNIYTNEALFAARLHPRERAVHLSESQRDALFVAIKATLRGGIRYGGSTIRDYRGADGERGGFQERLQVYGRAGRPCRRRCGALIEKLPAPRDAQPGFFCPRCQPPLRSS